MRRPFISSILLIVLAFGSDRRSFGAGQGADDAEAADNAAALYLRAAEMVYELPEGHIGLAADAATGPLPEATAAVVADSEPLFDVLRQAARLPRCQFATDYTDHDKLFSVGGPSRGAMRLAGLRFRHKLTQGDHVGAVRDLLAAATFTRRVGGQRLLIFTLVQDSAEAFMFEVLAPALPRLDDAALRALDDGWAKLPPPVTMRETIEFEAEHFMPVMVKHVVEHPDEQTKQFEQLAAIFGEESDYLVLHRRLLRQLRDDPKGYLRDQEEAIKYWRRIAKVMDLPPAQFKDAAAPLRREINDSKIDAVRALVAGLADPFPFKRVQDIMKAKRTMIDAALAFQREGERGFMRVRDPFGDGPFVMRKTGGGYELHSKLDLQMIEPEREPEPVMLRFGPADE